MGSEMCIRDRSKRYVHYVPVHFLIVPRPKKCVVPAIKLHAKNSCLLYTSDAADDLLCVDLGGRRIIKKKL